MPDLNDGDDGDGNDDTWEMMRNEDDGDCVDDPETNLRVKRKKIIEGGRGRIQLRISNNNDHNLKEPGRPESSGVTFL